MGSTGRWRDQASSAKSMRRTNQILQVRGKLTFHHDEEHCVCEASHETGLLWGNSSCYDGMMTFACCHVPCLRSLTVVLELGHGWTGSFGYPHALQCELSMMNMYVRNPSLGCKINVDLM